MEPGVLDASALLTVIHKEAGSNVVLPLLLDSVISVVNAAEVQAKLVRAGEDPDVAWDLTTGMVGSTISFDAVQAKLCGSLIAYTKKAGLSAGDRACLALAITMGLPVYTTDRAWSRVNVGCDIRLIR